MRSAQNDGRENNINLLRLVAASSVIFSHAYDFVGRHDPIMQLTGYSGGWVAVSIFFTLSGYLIYNSIFFGRDVKKYLIARCLRIFPGLVAMLVVTTIILGLYLSTVTPSIFFSSTETWHYLFGNAILYDPRYTLPGVFEGNFYPRAVNGSLWTLRFEFTCYLITLGLFLIGSFKRDLYFVLFCLFFLVCYMIYNIYGIFFDKMQIVLFDGSTVAKLFRLYFAFFIGMCYARFARKVSLRAFIVPILMIICIMSYGLFIFPVVFMIFLAYITFYMAFLRHPYISYVKNMPDISYGIYIYAFPIQQTLIQFFPLWSPMENSMATLVLTTIPATLSWFLIERPALDMKRLFADRRIAR